MVRYNQVLVQGFFNDVFAAVHTIECDYRWSVTTKSWFKDSSTMSLPPSTPSNATTDGPLQPSLGSRILQRCLCRRPHHRMRLQMFLQVLLQRQLLRFVKNAPQKIMRPFAMRPIHQVRTL